MSTRATVHFNYGKDTVAIVYRHSDGYPEGLGVDLKEFFNEVKKQTDDPRFSDPSYLAAKFVVWQAAQYSKKDSLAFLGVGIVMEDPGDIEYRYFVDCNSLEPTPKVTIEEV